MSEKIVKQERTLILGFYSVGDEVEVESKVDPWIEGELGNVLLQRSRNSTQALLDKMLRDEYEKITSKNK